MFNPFRSKQTDEELKMLQQQKDQNIPRRHVQYQEQDLQKLQDYLESLMKMKQIENKLYLHCANTCINKDFDDNKLTDMDRTCLKNCNGKIQKYIALSKQNFKKYDEGLEDLSEGFKNNAAAMKIQQMKQSRMM